MSLNEMYEVFRQVMVRIRDAEALGEGVLLDSTEIAVLADGLRSLSDAALRSGR